MRSILCYGDSNTWGYAPGSAGRFGRDIRWTGVLQRLLGEDWLVIEEGLCGRTVANSTTIEPEINGFTYLPACLKSHAPLDWVVLMLGMNDLQVKYGATPLEVARSIEKMVQLILTPYHHEFGPVPQILLLSPVPAGEGIRHFALRELFGGESCIDRSRELARRIRGVAGMYGCGYLEAGAVAEACAKDGLHLDEQNHRKLAEAVHAAILQAAVQ